MTTDSALKITAVVQEAFIDVFEQGTEAAAATGVVESVLSLEIVPPPEVTFVVDHAFAYVLRDTRTGTVLFMGRLTAPVAIKPAH